MACIRNVNLLKNAVFWGVALCRSCVNRRFGGTYRLHLQGRKIREQGTSLSRWLQTELNPHNKELHNLYSSPSIITMIKSRTMKRARRVARMGRR
jgi:hypothetical protein